MFSRLFAVRVLWSCVSSPPYQAVLCSSQWDHSKAMRTCNICDREEGRVLAGRVPQITQVVISLVWHRHTCCSGVDCTERIVLGCYWHVAHCHSKQTSESLVHEHIHCKCKTCMLCIVKCTTHGYWREMISRRLASRQYPSAGCSWRGQTSQLARGSICQR